MFTQLSLSLKSSNYTLKIKLDDKALDFFKNEKDLINKQIKTIEKEVVKDEYEGEVFGLAFKDVTEDFMIKELNNWKKFFESNGLTVYEPKVVSLKNRLSDLKSISTKNREVLVEMN